MNKRDAKPKVLEGLDASLQAPVIQPPPTIHPQESAFDGNLANFVTSILSSLSIDITKSLRGINNQQIVEYLKQIIEIQNRVLANQAKHEALLKKIKQILEEPGEEFVPVYLGN